MSWDGGQAGRAGDGAVSEGHRDLRAGGLRCRFEALLEAFGPGERGGPRGEMPDGALNLPIPLCSAVLPVCSVSAWNPPLASGALDVVQVVLVVSALLADAVALWAIAATQVVHQPRAPCTRERQLYSTKQRTAS